MEIWESTSTLMVETFRKRFLWLFWTNLWSVSRSSLTTGTFIVISSLRTPSWRTRPSSWLTSVSHARRTYPAENLSKNASVLLSTWLLNYWRTLLTPPSPIFGASAWCSSRWSSARRNNYQLILLFTYIFFISLSPWPARDINSYLRNMKTCPLRFPYDKPIGANTKDFITRCLTANENQRISWEEVFKHPILK